MSVPTAAWPVDRLLLTLQRRGWGPDLDDVQPGLRTVLHALVSLLPHKSGQGTLTANQVADAAHLSVRWTRHCLAELEAGGWIVWRRGWLEHGRPRPGYIRLVKAKLAEACRRLAGWLDDRRAKRRQETAHRVATTLRQDTLRVCKRRNPLSPRAELGATLHHLKVEEPDRFGHQPALPTLPGGTEMICETCGLSDVACQKANERVPRPLRHRFVSAPSHRQLVAAVRSGPVARPAPAGWRASARPAHPQLDLSTGSEDG